MKKVLLIAAVASFFWACNNDNNASPKDTTKPTVKVLSSSPDVHSHDGKLHIEMESGDTLNVTLLFEDNEALKQYKLEIHSAEDGHSHARLEADGWEVESIHTMSGKSYTATHSFAMPAEVVTGNYHFIVNATDAAGNEANELLVTLEIEND